MLEMYIQLEQKVVAERLFQGKKDSYKASIPMQYENSRLSESPICVGPDQCISNMHTYSIYLLQIQSFILSYCSTDEHQTELLNTTFKKNIKLPTEDILVCDCWMEFIKYSLKFNYGK